jgi:hypothetical protein
VLVMQHLTTLVDKAVQHDLDAFSAHYEF